MFTGIVTRIRRVAAWDAAPAGGRSLVLEGGAGAAEGRPGDLGDSWADVVIGESIAVNGCCLTVVDVDDGADRGLAFDVIEESLRRTAFDDLAVGSLVNLERSLRVGDRLGGHYVTGHVDAVGRVAELRRDERETILRIAVTAPDFAVIPKGSVTIDGVSLTVADVVEDGFTVALIPHTLAVTNLGERREGERVNLEMDHFGKWVRHLVSESEGTS